jgi:hypothetical protein
VNKEVKKHYHNVGDFSLYFEGAKHNLALDIAQDIRKFEIELYWKRATYFWTILAAAFVGFGAAQQLNDKSARTDMSVVVACLGSIFSFAWFCINKGNKYWQTNWEQNVEVLEDDVIGPLYKLNWEPSDKKPSWIHRAQWWLMEGDRDSVTRINQLVSFFVFLVWVVLLWHVLPVSPMFAIRHFYTSMVVVTVVCWILVWKLGKSGRGRPHVRFTIRGEEPPAPPSNSGTAR